MLILVDDAKAPMNMLLFSCLLILKEIQTRDEKKSNFANLKRTKTAKTFF